jgi:hypothetical protein
MANDAYVSIRTSKIGDEKYIAWRHGTKGGPQAHGKTRARARTNLAKKLKRLKSRQPAKSEAQAAVNAFKRYRAACNHLTAMRTILERDMSATASLSAAEFAARQDAYKKESLLADALGAWQRAKASHEKADERLAAIKTDLRNARDSERKTQGAMWDASAKVNEYKFALDRAYADAFAAIAKANGE